MKVIGLLSRKGGVGKTTLAVHLAVLAQQVGQRTLLIDLDPQRSAAAWWRAREAETPALVETEPAKLRGILDAARADGVDLVVVDTPPSVEADVAHVAGVADLVLIPTRAGDPRPARHPGNARCGEGRRAQVATRSERLPAATRCW